MAQIESDKHDAVVSALKDSGIYRMALFARLHRKRSGEATVLALKREFPEQIVLGTAKPFNEREDLEISGDTMPIILQHMRLRRGIAVHTF